MRGFCTYKTEIPIPTKGYKTMEIHFELHTYCHNQSPQSRLAQQFPTPATQAQDLKEWSQKYNGVGSDQPSVEPDE
jgi:hypothetical protein